MKLATIFQKAFKMFVLCICDIHVEGVKLYCSEKRLSQLSTGNIHDKNLAQYRMCSTFKHLSCFFPFHHWQCGTAVYLDYVLYCHEKP